MKVRCLLIGIVVLFVAGVLTVSSYAKIDPKTCVGMWLFDDTGGVVKDSSGNGHDGKIVGNVKRVEGKFKGVFSFPGTADSYVTIPHEETLNLTTHSITAWIKLESTGGYQNLFWKSPGNYDITIQGENGKPYTEFQSGGTWRKAAGNIVVTDAQWHHVAATYDMKFLRFYNDGTLSAESPFSVDPDTNSNPITIGQNRPVKGSVDEVGLFNVGLSGSDIKGIMDNGLENAALGKGAAVASSGKLTTTWADIKNSQ